MDSSGPTIERLRKGGELVRRIALLLSGEEPLPRLFGRLTSLLAEFVDASIVLIATGTQENARVAYVYQDGTGGEPDDPRIVSGSTTDAVLQTGEQRLYASGGEWPTLNRLSLDGRELHLPESAIFVPILFGGSAVGVLSVQSRRQLAYDSDDAALLETCALYLGARIHDEAQREKSTQLEQLAWTDALTTLANRRTFDETLAREWRRCARASEPLSIGLLDIDYFKRFNDAYGHLAGDTCLRQIAQAIAHALRRPGDFAARYGGEEFGLVLSGTDPEGAARLGESICEAIRSLKIPHQESSLGFVTVSIGIVTVVPQAQEDPKAALGSADSQLYSAKSQGRNRVAAAGHASQAPAALEIAAGPRHNLPASRTSFVGRDADTVMIAGGLQRSRLVTIAGTGGVGKTRLALEVAGGLIESFPNGVWFVDLAPIADPQFVASTIAVAAGINLGAASDALETLTERLRPQRLLLVIDNCEQVVDETARVTDRLLSACPGLHVLATSREPLHVAGEAVHRLSPLDESAATELFVRRMQDANSQMKLQVGERETVAELCRKLDGLALAIELAAARTRTLSLSGMLRLIEERFKLLTGGARTAPVRHHTLRALIDWSFDLLSDAERRAFARLAVFAGTFSVEAADAIAIGCGDRWMAVETLDALADKSMIVAAEDGRYRLLDSLRAYAIDELRRSGEEERCRLEHARFFASEAERLADIDAAAVPEAVRVRFEADLDDYRAALECLAAHDAGLCALTVGHLGPAWTLLSLEHEGFARAEDAIAALGANAMQARYTHLWIALAWRAANMFATLRSRQAAQNALDLSRESGDLAIRAEALQLLGMAEYRLGEDCARSGALLGESVEIFRALGKPYRVLSALSYYAITFQRLGDFETARRYQEEVRELADRLGRKDTAIGAEVNLAEVEFELGNADGACSAARRCVALQRQFGTSLNLANVLANFASYHAVAGDVAAAADAAREAISIARPYEAEAHVAIATQALALCEAKNGDARKAARMLGYVDGVYDRRGAVREPTEATVRRAILDALHECSDSSTVEAEMERGRALDLDDAYRLAIR